MRSKDTRAIGQSLKESTFARSATGKFVQMSATKQKWTGIADFTITSFWIHRGRALVDPIAAELV